MANQEHVDILKQGAEVWNEWRIQSRNIPDLVGTTLSGMDLSDANLVGAHLIGADLSESNMSWTNLTGAYLIEANLSSADLGGATLTGTDLRRANLSGANLGGAEFLSFAKLDEANLSRARMYESVIGNVDLSNVIGLDTVEHLGPSTIGLDTIYQSRGKIPEVFLRGCGVDESFITYMRSLVDNPIEFYSCFISYSHADKSFARRLHDQLQARGIRCWLDEYQMQPGDVIYDEIHRGIRLWDKVLLCCSEPALTSWWVDNEVATAFEKEQELGRQRGQKVLALIPLDLDGALFKQGLTDGKSAQLRQRLAADFTGWESDNAKFEAQFEKVVNALKTGDAGREPPPVSRL